MSDLTKRLPSQTQANKATREARGHMEGERARIAVSFTRKMFDEIHAIALEENLSMSSTIQKLIRYGLTERAYRKKMAIKMTQKRKKIMRKVAVDILRLIAEGHERPRELAQAFFAEYEVIDFKVEGMD